MGALPVADASVWTIPGVSTEAKRLEGAGALQQLANEWRNGLGGSACSHFFQDPAWLAMWFRHRAEEGHRAVTVELRDRGHLVGLAPMVRSVGRHLKYIPCRRLDVMGNDEPVLDNFSFGCDGASGMRAVLGVLAERNDWDVLTLNTRTENVSQETLEGLCREQGFHLVDQSVSSSPYLELAPTWDEFNKKALRSKFRTNLRQREARLAEMGPLRHEVFTDLRDADAAMDRILPLSLKGWAHKGGTAIGSTPRLQAFYREMARMAAAQGALYLHILSVGGRDVAFEYNLLQRGIVLNLKIAFDQELSAGAPGQVLKRYVIADAIERGATAYNLLGVNDDYKRQWTEVTRRRYKWTIFHRHFYAQTLHRLQTHVWSPWRRYQEHRHAGVSA